jgi:hypothetical protein
MSNTITERPTATAKPVADTTYELVGVIERLSFWSIAFASGYIGYYVFFNTIFDLFSIFVTTV